MTWRATSLRRTLSVASLTVCAFSGAGAQSRALLDVRGFRYSRELTHGTGLTTVDLDAAVLAHSTLADLRIVDPEHRQVAYLLEHLDKPLDVPLPALVRIVAPANISRTLGADRGTWSWYRVSLPYTSLPHAQLVLHSDARVFDRTIRIAVQRVGSDSREAAEVYPGVPNRWLSSDSAEAAPDLVLDLPLSPAVDSAVVYLAVDEGDNAPLPIDAPTLRLPHYQLRFYDSADERLALLYGRPELPQPRYDLALRGPRVAGETASLGRLGPEVAAPADVTPVTPTVVFWCVLSFAVAVLIVLIVRLTRPSTPNPASPASTASSTSTVD